MRVWSDPANARRVAQDCKSAGLLSQTRKRTRAATDCAKPVRHATSALGVEQRKDSNQPTSHEKTIDISRGLVEAKPLPAEKPVRDISACHP